jgi:hypothetical protein
MEPVSMRLLPVGVHEAAPEVQSLNTVTVVPVLPIASSPGAVWSAPLSETAA